MSKNKHAKHRHKSRHKYAATHRSSKTQLIHHFLFGLLGIGIVLMVLTRFHTSGEDLALSDSYTVELPLDLQVNEQNSASNGPDDYNMNAPLAVALDETSNPLLEENTVESPPAPSAPGMQAELPKGKWHDMILNDGDNLTTLFKKYHLGNFTLHKITQLPHANHLTRLLHPGKSLRLLIDENGKLQQLQYEINADETLIVSNNAGLFKSEIKHRDFQEELTFASGTIGKNLRKSLRQSHISENQWLTFSTIFSDIIDFRRDLHAGDKFEILYKKFRFEDNSIRSGDIVAAKLITRKKTYTALYFQPQSGKPGTYYTPNGESLQKSFNRVPVKYKRISSPFNLNRLHPILKVSRPHEGVDLAAARGTPIYAVSDGRIKAIGTRGGYGKIVEVDHGKGITTLCAHMSRAASKLREGSYVAKGQVIGYVGSTGLATGPHVHFEYRINGKPKNPMQVQHPKGHSVPAHAMTKYKKESTRLLAQLDIQKQASATVIAQR